MDIDLEKLGAVMALMERYRINSVDVGGVKLTKSLHLAAPVAELARVPSADDVDDEDLFWSAS